MMTFALQQAQACDQPHFMEQVGPALSKRLTYPQLEGQEPCREPAVQILVSDLHRIFALSDSIPKPTIDHSSAPFNPRVV